MKTYVFFRTCAVLLLVLLATLTNAQSRSLQPVSKGYWTVETNLTTRDYTIVRFYDAQVRLVYEERLPGLCLDLTAGTGLTRRTGRQLTLALHEVLKNPATAESTTLLARQLQPNRRVQREYAVR